jgi:hypothetical protein
MTKITTKETSSIVVPNQPARGFDSMDAQEDLIIPRAKLLQAMSPELADKEFRKKNPGVGVGNIINSLTKEPLPETFIPIFMFKNWIRFNPRNSAEAGFDPNFGPGDIIWRTADPQDPKVAEASFGANGEKPLATAFLNFFCYFEGATMPIIVSFSKTSYKAGKQLLSLAKFANVDMFARKYRLFSEMESSDVAQYAVFKVDVCGKASDEEYKIGEGLWTEFAQEAKNIKVHDEAAQEERPY